MIVADHQRIVSLDRVFAVLATACVAGYRRTDVIDEGERELIVYFPDHVVLRCLEPLAGSCLADVNLKTRLHALEYFQAFLVPDVDLGEQRIVVSGILVEDIVLYDDNLQLLHVKSSVHLYRAFVNHFNDAARFLHLLTFRFLLIRLIPNGTAILVVRFLLLEFVLLFIFWFIFFSIFVQNGLIYLFSLLFALIEVVWVSTNDKNTKIDSVKPHVDVKKKLFGYSWNANGCPSFTSIFHAWVCVDVVEQHLHVVRPYFGNLFGIGENCYGVQRRDEHTTCKRFWQIVFKTFLNDSPGLIRHSERLERLKKDGWTFVAYVAHHVDGALEASNT
jgi:hypothetical protein